MVSVYACVGVRMNVNALAECSWVRDSGRGKGRNGGGRGEFKEDLV